MEWTSCPIMYKGFRQHEERISRSSFLARHGFWLLFLLFTAPLADHSQAAAPPVAYIAGSGNTALDHHVTQLLEQQLGNTATLKPLADNDLASIRKTPVITIGPTAFSRVRQANREIPVLALLVARKFIQSYIERSPGRISAVYYDVPLLRQALTGKAILPQANRVAMLATTESAELYEPLIDQLKGYDLDAKVFIADTEDQLIPTLIRALSYGDFLLAGPDDTIYNPRNIKHILLTAYRRNRILIGPSQAYVKAGALASSYAPFSSMAKEASGLLLAYLSTGNFPSPVYPDEYRIEVNQQVARSLNIPLPAREWIAQSVQNMINIDDPEAGP
ncbi:ABC transporter substrate-binding protein [Marinobacter daepoensis]|uniref:ABC transporter substrate-binding protein n=1 Tax=Marinobacter daepoensis TaxID=262077 RepID=UPI001FD39939|nr:ABC transporter substrate-binding protein [Marinobacter daepoensis]